MTCGVVGDPEISGLPPGLSLHPKVKARQAAANQVERNFIRRVLIAREKGRKQTICIALAENGCLFPRMSARLIVRIWLPVLFWMGVIFVGSTDALSSQRTSRIIVPVLRWIKPDISTAAINRIQFLMRKGGHMAEYAVLAILLRRALHLASGRFTALWDGKRAALAFTLATLYAITDEVHQSMVATRYGSVYDVLIDAAGAALGLGMVWLWLRLQHHWRRREADGPA
jgi:VanZ family protein